VYLCGARRRDEPLDVARRQRQPTGDPVPDPVRPRVHPPGPDRAVVDAQPSGSARAHPPLPPPTLDRARALVHPHRSRHRRAADIVRWRCITGSGHSMIRLGDQGVHTGSPDPVYLHGWCEGWQVPTHTPPITPGPIEHGRVGAAWVGACETGWVGSGWAGRYPTPHPPTPPHPMVCTYLPNIMQHHALCTNAVQLHTHTIRTPPFNNGNAIRIAHTHDTPHYPPLPSHHSPHHTIAHTPHATPRHHVTQRDSAAHGDVQ
jgi:hypothetical protein